MAARLGANLFYTRLSGHGRTGAALDAATANDWLNDAVEALEIGKRLGDRVIVIGTSTGGTLATWLVLQPGTEAVLACVLISPNFGPRDPMSEILTWPWARHLVTWVVGPEYAWTPASDREARYWTYRYPSTALVTMMSLVAYVRESNLERIETPVLVVYSPDDEVVNAGEIERRYAQFGSKVKRIEAIDRGGELENHVLAGDILAPDNTPRVERLILDFVAGIR